MLLVLVHSPTVFLKISSDAGIRAYLGRLLVEAHTLCCCLLEVILSCHNDQTLLVSVLAGGCTPFGAYVHLAMVQPEITVAMGIPRHQSSTVILSVCGMLGILIHGCACASSFSNSTLFSRFISFYF